MKILITLATFAPSLDGATYLPAGTLAEVETDTARAITVAGKGLYVDGKDDPTRRGNAPGAFTASEQQITAAREALAALKKQAKADAS